MIPYIIINGKSSKNVTGLLIQSLPPISKPAKRVDFDEIDGRDGDKSLFLGWEAYDKTISIGLKPDAFIDDIIEYFNQSGEIIFSNEIDKFYKFSCYNKIDFNRLVRYKTANVVVHVQPFKYPVDEQPVYFSSDIREPLIYTKKIKNTGNVFSKPVYKIKGSGDINIYLNGQRALKMTLPNNTEATLDTEDMNLVGNGQYLNRLAVGDYEDLALPVGVSDFTLTGDIEYFEITRYSRWI